METNITLYNLEKIKDKRKKYRFLISAGTNKDLLHLEFIKMTRKKALKYCQNELRDYLIKKYCIDDKKGKND